MREHELADGAVVGETCPSHIKKSTKETRTDIMYDQRELHVRILVCTDEFVGLQPKLFGLGIPEEREREKE